MGGDKSRIDYHGLPQRDHAAQLLQPYCKEVYLSVRPDQRGDPSSSFPLITDSFLGLGPLGAILSAFRERPDAAWLVIACDLPFLHPDTLELLIRERNPSLMATAFNSPVNKLPEPLIAIWEPRSYPILLQFLAQGYDCPRKALINSPIHLLEAPDPQTLENVNTPEEKEMALEKLRKKE
ncbi:MAG: NTP transferase domain-containing protein [Haliscomenobacter sp.]|nr:NTP transferase domain-containing protein [Haliscomenobacter sp.]